MDFYTISVQKGVFQGDPYSPIIFLVTFNPLIQYLKGFEDKFGYEMNIKDADNNVIKSSRIITTPFCDDFNLLTRHKTSHQKLQDDIQAKVCAMGLTLKPRKCRTLSMVSGKPSEINFTLTDSVTNSKVTLKTLVDEPHKFLGQILTFKNSTQDHF